LIGKIRIFLEWVFYSENDPAFQRFLIKKDHESKDIKKYSPNTFIFEG